MKKSTCNKKSFGLHYKSGQRNHREENRSGGLEIKGKPKSWTLVPSSENTPIIEPNSCLEWFLDS